MKGEGREHGSDRTHEAPARVDFQTFIFKYKKKDFVYSIRLIQDNTPVFKIYPGPYQVQYNGSRLTPNRSDQVKPVNFPLKRTMFKKNSRLESVVASCIIVEDNDFMYISSQI